MQRGRLYVETNFLLEIVLRQEQAESAESLLLAAESGVLEMAVPEFSLAEAYARVRRLGNGYAELHLRLQAEVTRELARSAHYTTAAAAIEPLLTALREWTGEQLRRIDETALRALTVARCLAVNGPLFEAALRLAERLALPTPDAVVLAAILHDLDARPTSAHTAFATRDTRFHEDRAIRDELESRGCRCIPRFGDAASYLVPASE